MGITVGIRKYLKRGGFITMRSMRGQMDMRQSGYLGQKFLIWNAMYKEGQLIGLKTSDSKGGALEPRIQRDVVLLINMGLVCCTL